MKCFSGLAVNANNRLVQVDEFLPAMSQIGTRRYGFHVVITIEDGQMFIRFIVSQKIDCIDFNQRGTVVPNTCSYRITFFALTDR
jgi:hypothetical protein